MVNGQGVVVPGGGDWAGRTALGLRWLELSVRGTTGWPHLPDQPA